MPSAVLALQMYETHANRCVLGRLGPQLVKSRAGLVMGSINVNVSLSRRGKTSV